jgi:hypothetical protein
MVLGPEGLGMGWSRGSGDGRELLGRLVLLSGVECRSPDSFGHANLFEYVGIVRKNYDITLAGKIEKLRGGGGASVSLGRRCIPPR